MEMKNEIIDELLNGITKKVINEIVPKVQPKSIMFTGSFGRGEVAVIECEGQLKFLSDCEISIVPNKHISKKVISEINHNLSMSTNLEYTMKRSIGLKIYSSLHVPQIISRKIWRHSIQRYDLRNGSRIIYGENCLDKTPNFEPADIPIWEGIRLMFNRMAESLMYFSIDGLYMPEERQKLAYWISKTIIACQDVLLLSVGRYNSSYEVRNRMFNEAFSQNFAELNDELPNFLQMASKATNYKLNPKNETYEGNITELWFETVEMCDKVFRYIIEKDMGLTFNTYGEFQEKYLKHPKIKSEYYNELFSSTIYRNAMLIAQSPNIISARNKNMIETPLKHIIYSTIPLIYFSLSMNGNIDITLLKQARTALSIFKKPVEHETSFAEWDCLNKAISELWAISKC